MDHFIHQRKMSICLKALAAVLVFAAVPAMGHAAEFHRYRALALNDAGTLVAALETATDTTTYRSSHTAVVLRDARTGQVQASYDPCATCSYDQPAFAPHGDALAFVASDSSKGKAYVYVIEHGAARQLCALDGIANTVRFAPDGRSLAFLATPNARKLAGAIEAGARQVGEIGRTWDEQRVAVVPRAGGPVQLLSPADTYVYAYDWTPDSNFAVVSAQGDGDNNFWIARLNYLNRADGTLRLIAAPSFQMNRPKVSPDGRQVAFIGGLMSDLDNVGGDVYTAPLAGGELVNRTAGRHATYNVVHWRGGQLLAGGIAANEAVLDRVDAGASSVATLWHAPAATEAGEGAFAFSSGSELAATVAESFTEPPRILAGPATALQPLTHDNAAFGAQVDARSVTWQSDGMSVQGWLLSPRARVAGQRYPMLVSIHGGPANLWGQRYVGAGNVSNPTLRTMVEGGYFLFLPNPRGSFGQGQAFTQANRNDFGGGDWRDIERGIDQVLATEPVDPRRLGIYGHSYGGFMTMWAVTHSQRFKAAVASAGISNWNSYYGQNGIDQWMVPYFGASAYDAPERYRRASPIESIKAARTPTLLLVGEADLECPPAQQQEFWHGLRAMGVPTKLVIYPDEGHTIRNPTAQRDQRDRLLGWFNQYLR